MKKTFTLLATVLLSAIVYAWPNQSILSVASTGTTDLRIMVDGNKYKTNNNSWMIKNLNSGYHTIKIYQVKSGRNENQRYGYLKNSYQLVYNSNFYIKPQYHTDITINRFGKALVDEQLIPTGYVEEEDDWGYDNSTNHTGYGNQAMDSKNFDQLKQSLKNESFDNTRLLMAKQVIAGNYFTSIQAKELVSLFSFENNMLEMAKYTYDFTVDKGNYFIINDVFSFSRSKEELIKYIQSRNN